MPLSPPLVLIPHVDWRRGPLILLLESLARQTRACRVVVIHDPVHEIDDRIKGVGRLDRATQRHCIRPAWWPESLTGGITQTTTGRAQCERWRIVEETAAHDKESKDGVVVLTLDDDMLIDDNYVKRTVSALDGLFAEGVSAARTRESESLTDPVLSWGGVDMRYYWRHYHDHHDATQLCLPQAGAMAFYADTFKGLSRTTLSQALHIRGGNEEIPVASFLWDLKIPIRRPFGFGPTPDKSAYDPRALLHRTDQMQDALRLAAGEKWPHARAVQQLMQGKRPAPWGAS